MAYRDMLEHPNWQKKRLIIFERDKFACTLCDDTETQLHVHHKSYSAGKKPWEYPISNLTTLCKHCHLLVSKVGMDSMSFLKICKEYSTDRNTLYILALTVHDEWKYSIGAYRIYGDTELEFRELISHGQFEDLVKLIQLSNRLKWLTDFSIPITTKAGL